MNRRWRESAPRRPARQRRNCPELETLEDRRLLAVTYHGGPLLRNVQVEPVFYGPYWNSGAGQNQASALDSFLSFLTNSSYMDMLGEYGVGRGALVDNGTVLGTAASTASVDDSTLQQALTNALATGTLPPVNPNRVYIVFTAPNVDVVQGSQDSVHNFYGYHDFFTGPAGASVYYAVIAHPIGNGPFYQLNDFQTLTKTVSHELAEAATDPGNGGWYDDRSGEEIGDIANGPRDVGVLNGYVVQAEWSARQRAIVLPPDAQWIDATSFVSAKSTAEVLDQAANVFTHCEEYFSNLVIQDYVQFLHRTPSATEVHAWVGPLESGLSDEQLVADFTSCPEYMQQTDGSDQAWLDALYHDVLGRDPDAPGEAAWLQVLASGTSRSRVASAFATSVEHESQVIAGDYQRFLGRSADASEVATWVSNLQHGMSSEQVAAAFVGCDEFYAGHGSSISTWLTATYQLLLQRAPDMSGFNSWNAYLQSQLGGG